MINSFNETNDNINNIQGNLNYLIIQYLNSINFNNNNSEKFILIEKVKNLFYIIILIINYNFIFNYSLKIIYHLETLLTLIIIFFQLI